MLEFTDGVKIDTSGPQRVIGLTDGFYVVGDGMCCPVDSREEGDAMIKRMAYIERDLTVEVVAEAMTRNFANDLICRLEDIDARVRHDQDLWGGLEAFTDGIEHIEDHPDFPIFRDGIGKAFDKVHDSLLDLSGREEDQTDEPTDPRLEILTGGLAEREKPYSRIEALEGFLEGALMMLTPEQRDEFFGGMPHWFDEDEED